MLDKPKKRKLINEKEIKEVARKVRASFDEEVEYVRAKRIKNGDILLTDSHNFA